MCVTEEIAAGGLGEGKGQILEKISLICSSSLMTSLARALGVPSGVF